MSLKSEWVDRKFFRKHVSFNLNSVGAMSIQEPIGRIFYFFHNAGFNLYRISPSGSVPITSYNEEDEYFRTTNYCAVRNFGHDSI